ncbi:hypothetical protein J2Z65_006107 [Paenibacillus aceris]|uniref:Uncharacterized protein n=1 Tax=Paenibacillus aceris TaxID=869555 RepID=A0ABS4I901_9BACL|nr:hypothetical protein [Paenibacillus aceris]
MPRNQEHNFEVIGYFFEPDYAVSAKRNDVRTGKDKVPEIGLKSVVKNFKCQNSLRVSMSCIV